MAHHAYYVAADPEKGIEASLSFIERELGLTTLANPDISILRFATFSVAEARRLIDFDMQAPSAGTQKAIIVTASRLFTPAQNALLKLFEEPNEGTTLFLVVPSEGVLLPTLRSRLMPLPGAGSGATERAEEFLSLSLEERKKFIAKLLDHSRDDKPEEKQEARQEALFLVQELTRYVHARPVAKDEAHMKMLLLKELASFTAVLHDASAPLKPIFEHLLMVLPDPHTLPRA